MKKFSLRLTTEEIILLKSKLMELDPQASIYLYGSRVDPEKKGGDIDLLIISSSLSSADVSKLRWAFYEDFGEQKMDIILDDGSLSSPFVKHIYPQAKKL